MPIIPLSVYYERDCQLVQDMATTKITFAGLHHACRGFPCEGCPHQIGCSHYLILTPPPKRVIKQKIGKPGPTNAELAKKHGVTKRQISKMRKQGLLDV